jgi:UDP-N-acetylglucosamine--N-acetylmuramyl-(pentapeptide) pyrophosphoryl-undecaprenol N-acetylglucosamine transferase
MEKFNILVAAGGTGGHLFPAVSVVEELETILGERFNAVFTGNIHRIEGKKVPALGYDFHPIPMSGFKSKFSPSNLAIPFRTLKSINICTKIIDDYKIDAVLCTGAYLSYPAGIAATMKRKPLILMESNVYPGKSIKALSGRSNLIFTAFEDTLKYLRQGPKTTIINIGNPVRKPLLNLPDKTQAADTFGLTADKKTLLVFGGSLGARTINKAVEKFIKAGKADKLQIIWQTGNNYTPDLPELPNIKILPFIDDMASAYAAADLVLARAGATTVAELTVTGKPALLVPYPHSANDHQTYNAEFFEKNGAGYMIRDNQLWDKIEYIIEELIYSEEKLETMATAAKKLAKPDAAANAAKYILKLFAGN